MAAAGLTGRRSDLTQLSVKTRRTADLINSIWRHPPDNKNIIFSGGKGNGTITKSHSRVKLRPSHFIKQKGFPLGELRQFGQLLSAATGVGVFRFGSCGQDRT
ncbi:unnamed protein product [Tenebrio molitor]|jgi:hypothetical protein|nr:unnamed protein product [Tenebrio molitor]